MPTRRITHSIRVDVPTQQAPPPLHTEPGRTETANARRLVWLHGDKLRYVSEWKRWIVWDGCRWRKDESGVLVQGLMASVARDMWDELKSIDQHHQRAVSLFVASSNRARSIDGAVTLARGEAGILISANALDVDPWLLNCPNGTLDLRTGVLDQPRQAHLITSLCPTPYDQSVACPLWEKFLTGVFSNGKGLINYLRRMLGYGITGEIREQILPILWGEGGNGKSTFVKAILDTLGDDYAGAPPNTLFVSQRGGGGHPTDMMTLHGRRLMMAQETDAGARLNEALIKLLTGGDRVTARHTHKDNVTFVPTHKLLLATNNKPEVKGRDHAIWRRLKLIPFKVKFKGAAEDTMMGTRLKVEAPGILAWLVRGCMEWQRGGLAEPEYIRIETEKYAGEQDAVGKFLANCCELRPKAEARATALYEAFTKHGGGLS